MGLGIDSCLLKSKEEVDLIARGETVQALKREGLIRTGIFGKFFAPSSQFGCYTSLKELPQKSYDFILVSTKSFDTESAARDLKRHRFLFQPSTQIILCQNGWGNAEVFCRYFPKTLIYNARVITGFIRLKPNEVKITVHADKILMGSLFKANLKAIGDLCESITRGGIPCAISPHIEKDLWAKMLYNCALNPLGAILDVPYGVLGEFDLTRLIMNQIIEEVFYILKAAGYQTYWTRGKDYLKKFYSDYLPSTAKHRSSTLQDTKAQKKTEIDALNGIIIKLAEKYKISVPVNQTIYRMIKFIERKSKKAC